MSPYNPANLKNAANGIENYGGVADWTQPAGTKSIAASSIPGVTPTGVTPAAAGAGHGASVMIDYNGGGNTPSSSVSPSTQGLGGMFGSLSAATSAAVPGSNLLNVTAPTSTPNASVLPGGITQAQAAPQSASLGSSSPGGQIYRPLTSAPGLTMQGMENPRFAIHGGQTLNQQPASLTGYGQNLLSAGTTGDTYFDPSGINESYYATGGQVYQPSGAAQYSETDQARLNEQAMGFAGFSL